jgi:hypothetical protein
MGALPPLYADDLSSLELITTRCWCLTFVCPQAIWVAALAVALPALHHKWLSIPNAHVEVLAGAAAIGSVIAELFMIKSLVVFDPKISAEVTTNGHVEDPTSPRYNRSRVRSFHCISLSFLCVSEHSLKLLILASTDTFD